MAAHGDRISRHDGKDRFSEEIAASAGHPRWATERPITDRLPSRCALPLYPARQVDATSVASMISMHMPEQSLQIDEARMPRQTPFIVEIREPTDPSVRGIPPSASIRLTPALRTSGLLGDLSAEDVRNLLLILTFVTPNGWCNPSIQQLAGAMGVGETRAKARLARLVAREWHGKPLVHFVPRETGIDAYVPSHEVLSAVRVEAHALEIPAPATPLASRAAVLAHSRSTYTHPRAEVERQIAEMNGWELPQEYMTAEEREVSEVRTRMRSVGVTAEQCDSILSTHDLARIRRKLDWLPHRNAKNPAGFLTAAIIGNYEEPITARLEHLRNDPVESDAGMPVTPSNEEPVTPIPEDNSANESNPNDVDLS